MLESVEIDVPDHSLVSPASHGDLLIALCNHMVAANGRMRNNILNTAQQPWFRSCMKISLMDIMVGTHLNTVGV